MKGFSKHWKKPCEVRHGTRTRKILKSILETIDVYNKLAYKPVIMYDKNKNIMKPRLLKDMHEEEMEFITLKELRIWDDFLGK